MGQNNKSSQGNNNNNNNNNNHTNIVVMLENNNEVIGNNMHAQVHIFTKILTNEKGTLINVQLYKLILTP